MSLFVSGCAQIYGVKLHFSQYILLEIKKMSLSLLSPELQLRNSYVPSD